MRRVIAVPCAGETIAATLDTADRGDVGVLIVSGGNEVRCGAHRGMALLAASLAARGFPTLRFDRRGVGDSTGDNAGYASSAPDIAAAAAALRTQANVARVLAFGNCDAATALSLFHGGAGIDALVLSNPWSGDGDGGLPPPAAIRGHYARRLRDPASLWRLLRGGINFAALARGLRELTVRTPPNALVADMAAALAASRIPARILLAAHDNTAAAFTHAWHRTPGRPALPVETLDSDSHSYATDDDAAWLRNRVLAAAYSAASATSS